MGSYVGTNPNGVDLLMSDNYTSNSSKLLASTKCVYKAIEGLIGAKAAANMSLVPEEEIYKSSDGTSWGVKTVDGLIINCGYTPEEGDAQFLVSFSTEHYMLLGVRAFSRTTTSFVPECVNVQYIAIGI